MPSSSAIPSSPGAPPMVKRVKRALAVLTLAALMLAPAPGALAEYEVGSQAGEMYFPDEENWTYHFTYAYPHIESDDYAAILINETLDEVLNEWAALYLPMFADAPDMIGEGHNEVIHGFSVTCNNGRFFSVLLTRSQPQDGKTVLSLEPLVFDVSGEYPGETLTLRGVVMVGESSGQLSDAVLPVIWQEFQKLQESGVARADVTEEQFCEEFSPMENFYADGDNNAVFYIPPMLLTEPSFEPPSFAFSPAELNALLGSEE